MIERRKYPRYRYRLNVFVHERGAYYPVENLSLEGCFIPMDDPLPEGTVVGLIIEIPGVGSIPTSGFVQHTGGGQGIGVQFLEMDEGYRKVYAKFLKIMPMLEEIKDLYTRVIEEKSRS
ncbi:hypothetical protein G4V39_07275 [Thermosulfuriphilus ammonigenes]|uniref:Uncharacterized protein n=1 Tax=Thermosulfuriphilus ammonigenes TaxID=1936021 RepID=A0A6G7PWT8_9BACT|nr:PilZ domain-containing protein [Thermosulfuriphilus ammonigenes]MBA2847715.1 hypothetical protein [Thermosulfuriphilus ammonigenes]QIJ72080.1 hypothetical protein G4V39_07275 [Thermosulfuriphilus ammonigenes]